MHCCRRRWSAVAPLVAAAVTLSFESACATHASLTGLVLQAPKAAPRTLDTTRYFLDGEGELAKRAFDRGEYAKARALLTESPLLEVRFLRALAAYKARDFKAAAPELRALAEDYPPLADRCLLHAGDAYAALRQVEDAEEAYARVPGGTSSYPAARLALARLQAKKGRLEDALASLRPLVEATGDARASRAEALWVQAQLQRARGQSAAEQQSLLELWTDQPTSTLAPRAALLLPKDALTPEATLRRAEKLLAQRQPREALLAAKALLDKRQVAARSEQGCQARALVAQAQHRLGRERAAKQQFAEVVTQCQLSPARATALWATARTQEGDKARALYDELAREYPEHPLADDALLAAGVLALQDGDTAGALNRLDAVGERYPQGDAAPEALFAAFWWHRRQGNVEGALGALNRLDAAADGQAEGAETHPKVQYWRARLFEERGDKGKAAELFEGVAKLAPGTYYGLLARARLGGLAEPSEAVRPADAPGGDGQEEALEALFADPHFAAGLELLKLGLPDALRELARVELENKPAQARPLLLRVLYDGGRKRQVEVLSTTEELAGPVTPQTEPVWRLAFPDTFRALVEQSAQASNVDPNFLHALIREESRFRPAVRSSAGAVGLAQLMPSTARAMARQAGLKFSERGLVQPHKNLRLGSLYLRSLLDRFDGNVVYATAGYNAGPGAVDRWLKERPGLEVDDFVEEIPFSETRNYVKRVLASYAAYSLLVKAQPAIVARADFR